MAHLIERITKTSLIQKSIERCPVVFNFGFVLQRVIDRAAQNLVVELACLLPKDAAVVGGGFRFNLLHVLDDECA